MAQSAGFGLESFYTGQERITFKGGSRIFIAWIEDGNGGLRNGGRCFIRMNSRDNGIRAGSLSGYFQEVPAFRFVNNETLG
ncbi:MAG TPA: hypothetical protein PLI34_16580, partial [Saprospiraceae bacterium]|nr:hypothetical protein [Saprospiraceae bacterium]